jgi:PAS domain S-box-containing protein
MPLAEESALLFILSNVLLLIINNQKHNRLLDPLILFVISIIGMIAMITMYDIFTDYRWGGSDFIGEKGLFRSGFPTGKMSLITCFCFLLTSCSLYCIRFKFLKVVAYTNLMILAIAYIVLIGYIYGVPSLYNSSFIPMSWPASIAFIITSLGLILAAGNKSAPIIYFVGNTTRARLMRNLLPFTLLLLIVKIFIYAFNNENQTITGSLKNSFLDIFVLIVLVIFIVIVSKIVGNSIDTNINERKWAEEKLRDISKAVYQSPISIIITDILGNILYVNSKFEKISGYKSEEVIGKNPKILKSGYTSLTEYENLWKTITNGNEWKGEFKNINKKGEIYWEYVTISPIKNEEGKIIRFLGMKEDIIARKNVEEKLKNITWKQNHEIRGPLTTILEIISVMKYKISIDEKIFFLDQLEKSAKNLDEAIKSIVYEADFNKQYE